MLQQTLHKTEQKLPGLTTGREALWRLLEKTCHGLYHGPMSGSVPERLDPQGVFRVQGCEDSNQALVMASGMAMTGKRVAVWLEGHGRSLREIAQRHTPMTVFSVQKLHTPYHRMIHKGFFCLFARDAQHALDLAIVAQRVSALSLIPGLVAMDFDSAHMPQNLTMPHGDLLQPFSGNSNQSIPQATPAQHFIFGENRPMLPQWFHLDHPVASGWRREGADAPVSALGDSLFFGDHLSPLLEETMFNVSVITGRPLGFFNDYLVGDAKLVVVAVGAEAARAQMVAQYLRRERGLRIGVLGVTGLFSLHQVGDQLRGVSHIVILEKGLANEGHPLRDALQASLPTGANILSVTYGGDGLPVSAGQLTAICEKAMAGSGDPVHLGVSGTGPSLFPKRELVNEAVARAYPNLRHQGVDAPLDIKPQAGKTAVVVASRHQVSDQAMTALAEKLTQSAGVHVRGWSRTLAGGTYWGYLAVAPEVYYPAPDTPVDLALIALSDLSSVQPPALTLGGRIIFASTNDPQRFVDGLPPAWMVFNGNAFLYQGTGQDLIDHAPELTVIGSPQLVPLSFDKSEHLVSHEPPAFLRDMQEKASSYNSLPRFWGEVLQPREEGEAPTPDPNHALGLTPCFTAAFTNRSYSAASLPQFNADTCSGCGKCWVSCPDGAFGVGVLSLEETLDAFALPYSKSGDVAAKLKRAHKFLAGHLRKLTLNSTLHSYSQDLLQDAFLWLMEKMKVEEGEREEYAKIYNATAGRLAHFPIAATPQLYHQLEATSKGSGCLLTLTVNPRACQGCGICVDVCEENALQMIDRFPKVAVSAAGAYDLWETWPDVRGETLNHFRGVKDPLTANFMSKHCSQAFSSGDHGETGSGPRLAMRHLTGTAEYIRQLELRGYLTQLEELEESLKEEVQKKMTPSITDYNALNHALDAMPARSPLTDLVGRVSEPTSVDGLMLKRLTQLVAEIQALIKRVGEGEQGSGRARYGLVLDAPSLESLSTYPLNAFQVPVTAAKNGAALASGLFAGLLEDHLAEMKRVRYARAALKSQAAMEEVEQHPLTWSRLTKEEKNLAPHVYLIVDEAVFAGHQLRGLTTILNGDWPVKIVLLDGKKDLAQGLDPASFALAHGKAFLLSTAISHPQHLGPGLEKALQYPGPAFIHIHGPAPSQHSFPTQDTIKRAQLAVTCGVHPLFEYNPQEKGVFGSKLNLSETGGDDGNLAHWMVGEQRFRHLFQLQETVENGLEVDTWLKLPEGERSSRTPFIPQENGQTLVPSPKLVEMVVEQHRRNAVLREIAGVHSPFVESVRTQIQAEMEERLSQELAEMETAHKEELARLETEHKERMAGELTRRLMDLAAMAKSDHEVHS